MSMLEPITLFFLVPHIELCGVSSFTAHLYRALKAQGYQPTLVRIGSKSSVSTFPTGIPVVTMTPRDATILARSSKSLITYCFWKKNGHEAERLMELGVPMVIHDPAEFLPPALEAMRKHSKVSKTIVIRDANKVGLAEHGIDSTFIPHPYVAVEVPPVVPKWNGLCLARIDGRKRTEKLVEANKMLPTSKAIHMMGSMNRIYEYHDLRQKHPDWKRWYGGKFDSHFGAAVELFAKARFAVDFTGLVGDGGGTQYTFFEAWNAGVPLVLSNEWLQFDGPVKDGDNCIGVDGPEELAGVMRNDPALYAHVVEGGRALVRKHSPGLVIPLYEQAGVI